MLDVLRRKQAPADQLKRSYQNDLRAIGRYADDAGFHGIGVYEVDDGFILRGLVQHDPLHIEALEIPSSDVQNLILKNFTARGPSSSSVPLCPTGYEDFLRGLGYELEEDQARCIVIQELVDVIAVRYQCLQQTQDGYHWEPKSLLLGPDDIREVLDSAFRRRKKGGR